ncbi:outer membrane protein assembly factor BamE [Paraferrimonas haliotis]|uniref:Outer membrane protein assembly factor BamE n=1 Tax=Paraferrimonas haliotis TaxID=2013866 RepID=A0AA37TLA7_9GAMM|nr:outer membrane protein assembly factor BamE [Paraferrimonas haliotis]GLS83647.1 outer membrane protein assembly factor BamE [Paraferrimonas haliotis]
MITKKQITQLFGVAALTVTLSGCAVFDWLVYKIDIPQGNYIEKQQVEKLRVDMTKEQVEYVLGRPVLRDSFADDTWYYVYQFKSGRNAKVTKREMLIYFKDDKVSSIEGDYELSPDFNTPLGKGQMPTVENAADEGPMPGEETDPEELKEELESEQ